MIIKLKLFLFSPVWLWRIKKIFSLSRKYRKGKLELNAQYRFDLILKYAKKILKIFMVDLKISGKENLVKTSSLIVANHKSIADPFVLMVATATEEQGQDAVNPILTFLAKAELKEKLIVRRVLELIDTFFIERDKPKSAFKTLVEFGKFVKNNRTSGVIFPEGTRVDTEQIGEFKVGAFKVAKENSLAIVPTTIKNSKDVFNFSRNKRTTIEIIFHKPIKPIYVSSQTIDSLAKQSYLVISESYNDQKGK